MLCLLKTFHNSVGAVAVSLLFTAFSSLVFSSTMRRLVIVGGYLLSIVLSQAAIFISMVPSYGWLVMLAVLVLLYPARAWSDAPFFPTPRDVLGEIHPLIDLPQGSRILDAGCGAGHGLSALRKIYPFAHHHGVERSHPMRIICSLMCPWAKIYQGDLWKLSWKSYDLIYLFQRPESMNRALTKAHEELKAGSWIVSLEFEATGFKPVSTIKTRSGAFLWVYRITESQESLNITIAETKQD